MVHMASENAYGPTLLGQECLGFCGRFGTLGLRCLCYKTEAVDPLWVRVDMIAILRGRLMLPCCRSWVTHTHTHMCPYLQLSK